MLPRLLDVPQAAFQIPQAPQGVGCAQAVLLGFVQGQGGVVMLPRLLDVPQVAFQIPQTPQGVGCAQAGLLGFVQGQGGVVMLPRLLDVPQAAFQIPRLLRVLAVPRRACSASYRGKAAA